MNDIIIFGAGKKGKELLKHIGEESVFCFCDNNLAGTVVDRKKIVGFAELQALSADHQVILSTDRDDMRQQLKESGIGFYDCSVSYEPLRDVFDGIYENCSDSEVEFYFVDSFELTHYEPIYDALRNAGIHAVMVAEPCVFNTAGTWFDETKTYEMLDSYGIEWYKKSNPYAPVVITTEFGRNVAHYRGRKIQLCYGVSLLKRKAFELEPEITESFDHVLVNGEFYRERISKNRPDNTVTDIAYPRYREHFDDQPDKREILRKLDVVTDKPILVYYPTWDEHSSIPDYADTIGKLRQRFYVISKPHHCTLRRPEKSSDLDLLYKNSDLVVDTTGSLSDLAVITDLAICDAMSGSMCEVAYLNRDVRMVGIMESGTEEEFHISPKQITVTIDEPKELAEVAQRLVEDDPMIASRRITISRLISYDFGAGMDRCVEAIRTEINKGRAVCSSVVEEDSRR